MARPDTEHESPATEEQRLRQMSIAICVATFQRPKGLARLLESLKELDTEGFVPQLIIGDNDANGSAEAVVGEFSTEFPFEITYVMEPTRGISSVRNRLVAEAKSVGADYIAFVDDDETVDSAWLRNLLETAVATNADAVGGPQRFVFEEGTPRKFRKCFAEKNFRSGDKVHQFATNNVLIRLNALNRIPGPFDISLNQAGGADSLLSARLIQDGRSIYWNNDAITFEHVPLARLTTRWILRRQFRVGAGVSQVTRSVNTSRLPLYKNLVHGIGVIGLGGLRTLRALVTDRDLILKWLAMVSFGVGEVSGVFTSKATLSQYSSIEGE